MGVVEAAQNLAWPRSHMCLHTKPTAANAKPVLDVGAPGVHSNVLQGPSLQSWQEKGKPVASAATGEMSALLPKFHSPFSFSSISASVQPANICSKSLPRWQLGNGNAPLPEVSLPQWWHLVCKRHAGAVWRLVRAMERGAPKVVTGPWEPTGCLLKEFL